MSVIFSGTNQGRFVSDGSAKILVLRSPVDWIKVINYTKLSAQGADTGVQYYWQRGMSQGGGVIYRKTNAAVTMQIANCPTPTGFYLIDSSVNLPGPAIANNAIVGNGGLGNTCPRVPTGNTSGMAVTGDAVPQGVVRLFGVGTGALQIGGIDFSVANIINNASMDLIYAPIIVNAGAGGTYRMIPFDPIYYPRRRFISKVRAVGASAVISMTVTHGFTVGQRVRFIVPRITNAAFGMTELDGTEATVIAIGVADADGRTNTIVVNVDVSAFTPFAWPLTADPRLGPFAQVIPMGEDTGAALALGANILGDSVVNTGFTGIKLQAGGISPAGVANDVIYWVAGSSFDVDNI